MAASSQSISAPTQTTNRHWLVVVLLAIAVLINYVDRSNMSVAAPLLQAELGLSPSQLGWLLSAFFWTYALMQPAVGWLADRIGAGGIMAAGFVLWSLATSLTGFVHGFAALLAARLMLGVGESVFFPASAKILAATIPLNRIGSANSTVMAGLQAGPAVGILAGGLLMARFGWRPFFIVLGLASMLWLLPWLAWMPREQAGVRDKAAGGPSLGRILCERSFWGTGLGLFAGNYAWYFLLTWLPYYLVRERGMSAGHMARLGGVAYVCTAGFTFFLGLATDRWIAAGASHTLVRKSVLAVGYLVSGALLVMCAYAGEHTFAALLIVATALLGGAGFCAFATGQTIAGPQAAGKWVGAQNAFGNLSGVVAPVVTGFVVQRSGHFLSAFVITCMVCVLGACSWMFVVGRVEPMDWNADFRN